MDQELLSQLYQRYRKGLTLYLYSLCKNRALAEDLLQETFLKALLALPSGHPNLKAWLYLVARNLWLNFQKRESRLILQDDPPERALPQDSPLDQLIASEQMQALYQALAELEPRKREILQMQYFGELSQREIAAMLHLTPEYVRVLAHRARKELKQRMEENGYDIS